MTNIPKDSNIFNATDENRKMVGVGAETANKNEKLTHITHDGLGLKSKPYQKGDVMPLDKDDRSGWWR